MEASARVEKIIIPTYRAGKPEKNPMFMEKRVYQGSSGVVYPHPVIESISDERTDEEYEAVWLENEFLRIMILPALGGRIQRAYDKVAQRDFVYYNQVIKPALVGLAGPWISGGIEFNWPQHHRPSTFSPVDFSIEEHADGAITVWVNEVEVMTRTKGMAGFTLYPGKSYLEIRGRIFNRSAFPQSFLWWANPAVKVNDHYQSVFPPDVYAVFDHGKRDVSDFPIATGTYYKVDYSPGTDISRYANIPVPTSYMAIRSKYDFIGCYEHDRQAGMLHVADHHLSPGKKQWTWGNGDFGQAWDRNLTDEDGPYIELMTGVFTDNQPDFSWLQPNEEKRFEQYFMPYAGIGLVKNATKEAMVNLEAIQGGVRVSVYTTAIYEGVRVALYVDGELAQEWKAEISPYAIFHRDALVAGGNRRVVVEDAEGRVLVSYEPEHAEKREIPAAAVAAKAPADIEQVEDLYLNGLHLEQYRHATYNPVDYYEEGLRRSPGDVRCNNAMGLLLMRRGQFAKAEPYFRRAVETMTRRNPNPYDGEPYYNLGWSLLMQERRDEAYEVFYKCTWNDAWQQSGWLALARIAAGRQQWDLALGFAEKSLVRGWHSPVARHLKTMLLRKAGRVEAAMRLAEESLAMDAFNFGCRYELWVLSGKKGPAPSFRTLNNYLELSLDYASAGQYEEGIGVLDGWEAFGKERSPLPYYYRGWMYCKAGRVSDGARLFGEAAGQDPALCFPNKIEEILILQAAMEVNHADGYAPYYLGNLWYDKRQYAEAIFCWERSAVLNSGFPTAMRNLALAAYNKQGDQDRSIQWMERAFAADETDARVLMELDQLYKICSRSFTERLALLDHYPALVAGRDDLYLERIALYNGLRQYERARVSLLERKFHPWEGGEGKVIGQWLVCHVELAKEALEAGQYERALVYLRAAGEYPENLGEGKLPGVQENDLQYLSGCAYEGMGLQAEALAMFEAATSGISEPVQAIYYNDPQPDKIVFQALAWRKLGQPEKARAIFERFVRFGEAHLEDRVQIDYFAVSLPDMLVFDVDINLRNRLHCQYLIGLGLAGLGEEGIEGSLDLFLKGRKYAGAGSGE